MVPQVPKQFRMANDETIPKPEYPNELPSPIDEWPNGLVAAEGRAAIWGLVIGDSGELTHDR